MKSSPDLSLQIGSSGSTTFFHPFPVFGFWGKMMIAGDGIFGNSSSYFTMMIPSAEYFSSE